MKEKKFTAVLTNEDVIDVTLAWKDNKLNKFSLKYRMIIEKKWYGVYRVDTYHAFLHEQKFWRSPKPIPIDDKSSWSMKMIVNHYSDEIHLNFQKYRKYYEKAFRKGKINPK